MLKASSTNFAAVSFARFTQLLSEEDRRRRDRRIPPISLVDPYESAFFRLYCSGDDQSLITITGFDHRTFSYLLNKFLCHFISGTHLIHQMEVD